RISTSTASSPPQCDKQMWILHDWYINAIDKFKPIDSSVTKARILLLGPSGVGKSSFVNSFKLFDRQLNPNSALLLLNCQFRTYLIRGVEGRTFLNLALCDTMGLSEKKGAGLHSDDIVSIIQGHVRNGYKFRPTSPMTPETAKYVAAPTLNEKIHCVVYVMDASTVSDMSAALKKKLREIRQRIPQLVLMTKVDEADPSVIKNIRKVYKSEIIREKQLAALLDVPISCIFPVKNYFPDEVKLNDNCDVLLLMAVYEMLSLADNYMDDIATKSVNDLTERLGALSTSG
uniref:Uncharacterized protein n=1 Tax=Takifugu rubripes TaxID=31033 RepID=A0A674PMF3_TAKRU